jgi:hypothetical protein
MRRGVTGIGQRPTHRPWRMWPKNEPVMQQVGKVAAGTRIWRTMRIQILRRRRSSKFRPLRPIRSRPPPQHPSDCTSLVPRQNRSAHPRVPWAVRLRRPMWEQNPCLHYRVWRHHGKPMWPNHCCSNWRWQQQLRKLPTLTVSDALHCRRIDRCPLSIKVAVIDTPKSAPSNGSTVRHPFLCPAHTQCLSCSQ